LTGKEVVKDKDERRKKEREKGKERSATNMLFFRVISCAPRKPPRLASAAENKY
jgi:hypothetical protein